MKKNAIKARLLSAPYLVWAAIFVVAPMGMVVYYAFTDRSGAFTLDNVLSLSAYGPALWRSVSYAAVATLFCLLIAYPLAYIMYRSSASAQRLLMMLCMLPMWMNFLIRTYSWIAILAKTGLLNQIFNAFGVGPFRFINTPAAVILGMVYNFLPYMIMPIYSVMSKLNYNLIEAAEDLGCNGGQVLRRVILPLTMPGVLSGITMVFVPSVSTFYISQKLGGGKFFLIGDSIEMQFQSAYNYNLGAALSLVLMLMIVVCMIVMNHFAADEEAMLP